MRALIAEDDEDLRELLKVALEHAGWEVFVARDGREALRVYHNAIRGDDYFDVLLLDVIMPRLNGFAVGVNVRNFEKCSDGGVPRAVHVYFTGKEDVVRPEQLMEAEFAGELFVDGYIHKPIGPKELLAEIERLVNEAAEARKPPPTVPISAN